MSIFNFKASVSLRLTDIPVPISLRYIFFNGKSIFATIGRIGNTGKNVFIKIKFPQTAFGVSFLRYLFGHKCGQDKLKILTGFRI